MSTSKRLQSRIARHRRIRKKISGTANCPRLAVFRSARHIYAQAIDDENGHTLASASSMELKSEIQGYSGNKDTAALVGQKVAERLLSQSISQVVFDRGGFLYHGRIKALADAAREKGLSF